MYLYVVRHGAAIDGQLASAKGLEDSQRSLTRRGRQALRTSVLGLRSYVEHIDLILSSPLTRAVQSAEILQERYPGAQLQIEQMLLPDMPLFMLTRKLQAYGGYASIACVGHSPMLDEWIESLQKHRVASGLKLRKGAVCCLSFEQEFAEGQGELEWLYQPKVLQRLTGTL